MSAFFKTRQGNFILPGGRKERNGIFVTEFCDSHYKIIKQAFFISAEDGEIFPVENGVFFEYKLYPTWIDFSREI